MERLTKRDSKGLAYFDNDGVLLRGANGVFHQKKDMTAHYIHDRFVALDKALDRLAAYEDTGLTPEEIVELKREWKAVCNLCGINKYITPSNDPLTLEELREMDGEPVWIERQDGGMSTWAIVGDFVSLYGVYFGTAKGGLRLPYEECNKTWLAYRRKPEERTV